MYCAPFVARLRAETVRDEVIGCVDGVEAHEASVNDKRTELKTQNRRIGFSIAWENRNSAPVMFAPAATAQVRVPGLSELHEP
jgi:hypothetical protein